MMPTDLIYIEHHKGDDAALDALFNYIDDLLISGMFNEIEEFMNKVDVCAGYSDVVLLGILSITNIAKDKIKGRVRLYEDIKHKFDNERPTETFRLLKGFE